MTNHVCAGIFPGAGQRAHKAFEKGKPFDAKHLAYKSISKDSANPLGYLALSRCLIYVPIPREIDSAHWAELKASRIIESLSQKDSLRTIKKTGKAFNWVDLRSRIDSQAFLIAVQLNNVKSYEHFIRLYQKAPQLDLAIRIHDSLAYESAISEGTSEAFEDFLNRYPSSKQAAEAKSIKELFLFREMTLDGSWRSYQDFYLSNPNSPFSYEAHRKVFQLKTFNDEQYQYLNFLDSFPENLMIGIVDTLVQYQSQHDPAYSGKNGSPLWRKLFHANEQFDTTLVIVVPSSDGKRQSLLSSDSTLEMVGGFDSLVGVQLFNRVRQPWILTKKNSRASLGHCLFGDLVSSKEKIEFLSQNWIVVQSDREKRVMHISGKTFFPRAFDDLQTAYPSLFFGKRGKSWNAYSPNGHQYNSKPFDSVFSHGNLILGLRDSLWHCFNISTIRESGKFKEPQLFQDLDWSKGYLTTRSRNKNLLIDTYSGYAIEESEGDEIIPCPQGWLVKNQDRFSLMDMEGSPLTATPFKEFQQLNFSFAWKPSSKWIVSNLDSTIGIYDSVAPFGVMFNRFWNGDTLTIHDQHCLFQLEDTDDLKIHLEFGNQGKLFFSRSNGKGISFMDFCGNSIYEGRVEEIIPRTKHLFRIKKGSKYGLVDTSGTTIIQTTYDFISQKTQEYLILFKNRKYQLFNIETGKLSEINFSSKPRISEYGLALMQEKNDLFWIDPKVGSRGKTPNAEFLFQINDSLIAVRFRETGQKNPDSTGIYNLLKNEFQYARNGNLFLELKSENLLTEENGRYGVWDYRFGNQVLESSYDDILEYRFRNQTFFLTFLISEENENVKIELWDSSGRRKNQSMVKQGFWSDELF